ncbi:Mg-protoporyphyrin IX chelatase (plastid) [Cryptomonas paramecium]|uniref:magnesium chelatase n=1 Tax=Cryptomonas paramaecium TaxID=2898 RepID=D2ISE3_9CRYP|nr:Mg-protoporyphyrin IX chelatase [Cryptomonas paramecium]ACT46835.1 Mg-protoporyphyrin IX chelatase [Cryptomonas paramecium]BDA98043.1 Mg-protoporyphyrin IX chelatase [Cryptomonas paramecium]
MKPTFPFTAILGQDSVKLALLLNTIEPNIGGLLILGTRGTGKSTTVRAIKELLPDIKDFINPYPKHKINQRTKHTEGTRTSVRSMPMVELPLGATEEHICGTLNIEKAFTKGVTELKPGILAKAHMGFLYVDEINLLEDNLIDVLLDAAASGWNTIERDGISMRHPAKFVLIGSGNPEERDLRPQFADRFGMCAEPLGPENSDMRTKMLLQCLQFDKNPHLFRKGYVSLQRDLRSKILKAIHRLPKVIINSVQQRIICDVCSKLCLHGVRGDIAVARASRAHAAFEGRIQVLLKDIDAVIGMCLCHRLTHEIRDIEVSSQMVKNVFWETVSSL